MSVKYTANTCHLDNYLKYYKNYIIYNIFNQLLTKNEFSQYVPTSALYKLKANSNAVLYKYEWVYCGYQWYNV